MTFNGGKRGGIDTKRTITKTELALMGAIFPEDVARCRRRVKIGDAFTVADNSWKSEKGNGVRPVMRGRVTAKYPHFVTLDCGTSITYVQIIQYRRKRGHGKYID
ncbi:MAG: hypothetical protein ACLS70_18015 [[Clostridium] symbiosum]